MSTGASDEKKKGRSENTQPKRQAAPIVRQVHVELWDDPPKWDSQEDDTDLDPDHVRANPMGSATPMNPIRFSCESKTIQLRSCRSFCSAFVFPFDIAETNVFRGNARWSFRRQPEENQLAHGLRNVSSGSIQVRIRIPDSLSLRTCSGVLNEN